LEPDAKSLEDRKNALQEQSKKKYIQDAQEQGRNLALAEYI
jgi:hypothetical protein